MSDSFSKCNVCGGYENDDCTCEICEDFCPECGHELEDCECDVEDDNE